MPYKTCKYLRILLVGIFLFLLSSCATILNKKTHTVLVASNVENASAKINDSIYQLPQHVEIRRSNKDLPVTLYYDSLAIHYIVKPSPSPYFLYLNLAGFYIAPINYAIDFTNKRRFNYGRSIYLNSRDSVRVVVPPIRRHWVKYLSKNYPGSKNNFNIVLAVPFINNFNFKPVGGERIIHTGFLGIGAGSEYFYRPSKYISLKASVAADAVAPVPAPVSYGSIRESLNGIYVEATDNVKFGRLNLGYGLNYGSNIWRYSNREDRDNPIVIRKANNSIGVTANSFFQFSRILFVGASYRTGLLKLSDKSPLDYEHLISVDILIKLPLKR